MLPVVGGHHLLAAVWAAHGGHGGEVVKALASLALGVAEADLVVGLPGIGVGEGVHTAAGTGAVHEGTFQQVHWSHGQTSRFSVLRCPANIQTVTDWSLFSYIFIIIKFSHSPLPHQVLAPKMFSKTLSNSL